MLKLLSRVNLPIPITKLLGELATTYKLGPIKNFEYIQIGYEDLNIKLETGRGKYVVKIFSKEHRLPFIKDYIRFLLLFAESGIPAPRLLRSNKEFLYSRTNQTGSTYLCVMNLFEGKSFNEIPSTPKDLLTITSYLAKIHQLNFKVHKNYDSWGTTHLLEEFPKKKQYLGKNDLALIRPVIEKLQTVDFSEFRKCLIHGSLEKQNVLKNSQGKYCILDLGCLDFNAAVIDLAIFLAAFCLNPALSLDQNRLIYNLVISGYLRTNSLSTLEMDTLPLLIKAAYASYLLAPNYLRVKKHYSSLQTRNFLSLGRNGLRIFKNESFSRF